jgi:hypothetical protein
MTSNRDDGGPAFPQLSEFSAAINPEGMSLRDWFASASIQGVLTNEDDGQYKLDILAARAYALADAMLKERQK